jgi:formylglycine-generating enzyme required for sulfatase activity
VTTAGLQDFIAATGFRTDAENIGWSFFFASFLPSALRRGAPRLAAAPRWCAVRGARWDRREGPGSDLTDRADHPVMRRSWNALAYCVSARTHSEPTASLGHQGFRCALTTDREAVAL